MTTRRPRDDRRHRRPRRRVPRCRRANRARGARAPRPSLKVEWSSGARAARHDDRLRAFEDDRAPPGRWRRPGRRRAAARRRRRRARGRRARLRGELSHSLHRARAARAARGRGRMDRRQGHGLDRHAAAVRRARRSRGRVFAGRGSRARDRARTWAPGTAASTRASRPSRRRGSRARRSSRSSSCIARDEEFSWGYFRPAGVIDVKAGVDASGRLTFWEFDNWNSGNSGLADAVRRRQPARGVSRVGFAAAAGFVSRAGGDGESLRARDAHGRDGARAGRRCGGVPAEAPRQRAHPRGARPRPRSSPAGRARPDRSRARHRVRHREGQLHRHGRGGRRRRPAASS